jgi:predicted DNA binding CopG/RHH family protein
VPDIGGKEKKFMKTKIKYTDEPMGDIKIIDDFLPPPDQLAFKEDNIKVTITLSKASVDFFKNEAKKHHVQYQKMIRKLLDLYMIQHQKRGSKGSPP